MFIDKRKILEEYFKEKFLTIDSMGRRKMVASPLNALKRKQYEDAYLTLVLGNFTIEKKIHNTVEDIIEYVKREDEDQPDIDSIPDNICGEVLLVYPIDEIIPILEGVFDEIKKDVQESREITKRNGISL